MAAGMKSPHVGRSLMECIWEELDRVLEVLMSDFPEGEPETTEDSEGNKVADVELNDDGEPGDFEYWAMLKGQCQGLAYALAVVKNPYHPDIDGIRDEAMRRWEEHNADSQESQA